MIKLMTLAACLAVVGGMALPASAQPNSYGRPRAPYSGVASAGLPGVNPRGWPGLPGQGVPASVIDDVRYVNPCGCPGLPAQAFGPGNPWERPGLPGQKFGPAEFPGANPLGRPVPPGKDFNPVGPLVNPLQKEKDRDEHRGLGVIPHILHGAGHTFDESFKAASASELSSGSGRWAGKAGGGLLAAIGAAISGVFRALFGRKKDEGSA
jgi:hypothetical protein